MKELEVAIQNAIKEKKTDPVFSTSYKKLKDAVPHTDLLKLFCTNRKTLKRAIFKQNFSEPFDTSIASHFMMTAFVLSSDLKLQTDIRLNVSFGNSTSKADGKCVSSYDQIVFVFKWIEDCPKATHLQTERVVGFLTC